jgi:heptose I phosphotransferase
MTLELDSALSAALPGNAFDAVLGMGGEVYRAGTGRQTLRVEIAGRAYFLKRHRGVGWREIAKNLLQLRLPILGAGTEVRAIRRLEALGVHTMQCAGWGERGCNPARRESFVLTQALEGTTSLEDFCAGWGQRKHLRAADVVLKLSLLRQLAGTARTLHENGVNHRDFYLCHFLLRQDSPGLAQPGGQIHLHLIDLHRVQLRACTPRRWRVKDIAGLYFSALDAGLTQRDCFRFMRLYGATPLREQLGRSFWRQVSRRAAFLYRKAHGRAARLPVNP